MKKKDIQKLLKSYEEVSPEYLTVESYLEEAARWSHRPDEDFIKNAVKPLPSGGCFTALLITKVPQGFLSFTGLRDGSVW